MSTSKQQVLAFAPATVANLGPGFDVLGLALEQPGDTVVARRTGDGGVRIEEVRGDGGVLPREASANTAGIAAAKVLEGAGLQEGVALELTKGLPLGSGLGSSSASAAAAAFATNALFDYPLRKTDLIACCVEAEAAVSGRHADNVAPAILGGLVLVRSVDPLDAVRLPVPAALTVAVVTPALEVTTRRAREALPRQVALGTAVRHAANLAAMVSALYSGDTELLARSAVDEIVTPARADLIPGCREVIASALAGGALASSISGAGPSIFALCDSRHRAEEVAGAMKAAFAKAGLESTTVVSSAGCPGARCL